METWIDILNRYSRFSIENKQLRLELEWLNEKFNRKCDEADLNWANCTENEKRIRRIKDSKSFKKTEGYDSGVFKLEEAIIDLYEAIEYITHKLSNGSSDLLSTRLTAHILLLKKTINCYRDVQKVKDFFLLQLSNIIIDCLNSNQEQYFIEYVNILYFESKLDTLRRALSKKNI